MRELLAKLESDARFARCSVSAEMSEDGIVTLEGSADSWRHVVDIGHLAASLPGVVNVVNNLSAEGIRVEKTDNTERIRQARQLGRLAETDVLIVGAGICGCGIARELSKYNLKVAVIERNADVSEEATKANNGDIHPGHKAKPGTLKAKLNVRGNYLYDKWQQELGFELVRCGQINVAYSEEDMKGIEKIYHDGVANGVPGVRMLTREELLEREPKIPGDPIGGVEAPTMGVVEPFQVCVALAENAAVNGVQFLLSTELLDIDVKPEGGFEAVTERGVVCCRYLIDCAGIHADDVAEMAGDKFYTLHPRRGGIVIFDKRVTGPYQHAISAFPRNKDAESKGGGYARTPEGNILIGPSAVEIPDKEDKSMEESDFDYAYERGKSIYPELDRRDAIAMYSGIRPADYTEDFIIQMSRKVPGFIHVAGIQSPGLASAPAIAEMVEGILKEELQAHGQQLQERTDYQPNRKPQVQFRRLSHEAQEALIKENPKYGHIICRCEQITEGEILDVLHSPVVPTTVDAIKRRTRAGMGRCQGGFCQPRVVEILARELDKDWTQINLKGRGAYILERRSR